MIWLYGTNWVLYTISNNSQNMFRKSAKNQTVRIPWVSNAPLPPSQMTKTRILSQKYAKKQ